MMDYKEVSFVGSAGNCNDIQIDGQPYLYDYVDNRMVLQMRKAGSPVFILSIKLPLNIDNPKETIDKFFKLLLLQ